MLSDKKISLRELYFAEFELQDVFVMRQVWKQGAVFCMSEKRPSTGVVFLNNANGLYTNITGEEFLATKKSIVCIPQGSRYTCLNLDCSNTLDDVVLVEFNVVKDGQVFTFSDKPFLIKDVNIPLASELFNNAVSACNAAVPSALEIKTAVYKLLLHICKEKVQKHQKRFSIIGTGIELLEADSLCELTVEQIARECNVTSCYFRRLFKEYSGKSPQEYRMEKRLNMAKRMLENGESTLAYIAEALKFESTSYFCRVFKNKLGITPGEYRNILKS